MVSVYATLARLESGRCRGSEYNPYGRTVGCWWAYYWFGLLVFFLLSLINGGPLFSFLDSLSTLASNVLRQHEPGSDSFFL
ncbi:hypothetical protein M5K25_021042 [Dendrobium thyrsiflorum]|uniref:Uncharacterized protein n=1 Tax=Dendrobium thyrsiflorum TaxID=117978 RepID=A0ABD0UBM2_DENTH